MTEKKNVLEKFLFDERPTREQEKRINQAIESLICVATEHRKTYTKEQYEDLFSDIKDRVMQDDEWDEMIQQHLGGR